MAVQRLWATNIIGTWTSGRAHPCPRPVVCIAYGSELVQLTIVGQKFEVFFRAAPTVLLCSRCSLRWLARERRRSRS